MGRFNRHVRVCRQKLGRDTDADATGPAVANVGGAVSRVFVNVSLNFYLFYKILIKFVPKQGASRLQLMIKSVKETRIETVMKVLSKL